MALLPITRPLFDENEIERIRKCLGSGWVTQGPLTQEFEAGIAARHEVAHARATTSCTAALHLAAMALGLGPGDEVVVPAFTWITSANCAEYVGAKAVFADIDPTTYNLDPLALEAAITPHTRAVVAVHLFGLSADMDAILALAKKHDLRVIEDAACAIGTTYHGKPVGGIGDIGCFSFHPRKVITTGEGGMATTNNARLAELVASYRNHGSTGPKPAERDDQGPWSMASFDNLGFNLRLSDIQAAVGLAQLDKLDALLNERRAAAARYTELLTDINDLVLPVGGDVAGHSYQSYVVRVAQGGRARRNAIMSAFEAEDIQTRPGTHAVHQLGYYRDKYALSPEAFPHAAEAEDTTITLPIFPGITAADQERVAGLMRRAL